MDEKKTSKQLLQEGSSIELDEFTVLQEANIEDINTATVEGQDVDYPEDQTPSRVAVKEVLIEEIDQEGDGVYTFNVESPVFENFVGEEGTEESGFAASSFVPVSEEDETVEDDDETEEDAESDDSVEDAAFDEGGLVLGDIEPAAGNTVSVATPTPVGGRASSLQLDNIIAADEIDLQTILSADAPITSPSVETPVETPVDTGGDTGGDTGNQTDRVVTLTFDGESAGYRNSVGHYLVDDAGNITHVSLDFANASVNQLDGTEVGTSVDIVVPEGMTVGVFILANGFSLNNELANDLTSGTFKLVNADGELASVTDDVTQLVWVDAEGNEILLSGDVYHYGGEDIHVDDIAHDQTVQNADGSRTIYFEDLRGGGDADFNDMQLTLSVSSEQVSLEDLLTNMDDYTLDDTGGDTGDNNGDDNNGGDDDTDDDDDTGDDDTGDDDTDDDDTTNDDDGGGGDDTNDDGSGDDTGDKDKGHGNDADGVDEDNPGNSAGTQKGGKGNGVNDTDDIEFLLDSGDEPEAWTDTLENDNSATDETAGADNAQEDTFDDAFDESVPDTESSDPLDDVGDIHNAGFSY